MTDPTPLEVYRRMQAAVLRDEDPTLLPAELLADDVIVETPFSQLGMRRHEGREAWLEFYANRPLPIRFEEFQAIATHATTDPEVLVVEYELRGTVTTTGAPASAAFIAVLRVRDGKIRQWREYQDISSITQALSMTPEALGTASH